jgi:hypothetical protein
VCAADQLRRIAGCLTASLLIAGAAVGCGSNTSPSTTAELCANPKIVGAQPVRVAVLLDGAGSTEPDGGSFYPIPVHDPASGVPVVHNYCPLDPDDSERDFPAGLNDSLSRWSAFTAPGGAPPVSQACEQSGGFLYGSCLTKALADAGAVLLPYSYAGSTLSTDGRLSQNSYSADDSKQPLCTSVGRLESELASIHSTWPRAHIVLVGHGYGGLVAETWWYGAQGLNRGNCSGLAPQGVVHVFSLDSPINGVRHCGARAQLDAGDASATWCDLWGNDNVHGVPNGINIAAVDDRELTFTAVGTPNDPAYGNGPTGGGGGLQAQLVFDCINGADENDPTSDCIDRTGGSLPVSYTSPSQQCDAYTGNIYGSEGHELVKACPDVVQLIVSAFRPNLPAG